MDTLAKHTLTENLAHFAKKEDLLVRQDQGCLFIDHKEIDHGYDGGEYFAKCDYLFEVNGQDAQHVAAVFIAHMVYRSGDGFDIQLEPDWYRRENS